jgi:ribonuclease-3
LIAVSFENDKRLAKVKEFIEINQIPMQNLALMNTALTHTSYVNEHKDKGLHDNERLEFLGDDVLDLVVGEYLFLRFPHWPEGDLTRAKASAVCLGACAECASNMHVGDYLLLGRGEDLSGGRTRESNLGDAFEAIIGAVYLDNDYETTARFVLKHMKKFLALIDEGDYDHDYKTDLQELAQKHGNAHIQYEVIRAEGPDHDRTIWMQVRVNHEILGKGKGKSKKQAAQQAAKEAIKTFTQSRN